MERGFVMLNLLTENKNYIFCSILLFILYKIVSSHNFWDFMQKLLTFIKDIFIEV